MARLEHESGGPPGFESQGSYKVRSAQHRQMPRALGLGGQQLSNAGVQRQESRTGAHGRCQQDGVRDLSMPHHATCAAPQHVGKSEVQREQPVLGMCRVSQEQARNFTDRQRPSGKRGLTDDPHERSLSQRTTRPAAPRVSSKPRLHHLVMFVRGPTQRNQRVGVQQVGQGLSSSRSLTRRAVTRGTSAGNSNTHVWPRRRIGKGCAPARRISSDTACPNFRSRARAYVRAISAASSSRVKVVRMIGNDAEVRQ